MIGVRVTLDPTRDVLQQMTAAAQLTHALNQYLECDCDTFDCEHYRAMAPLVAAVTGDDLEEIEGDRSVCKLIHLFGRDPGPLAYAAAAAQAIDEIDDRFESALRRVRRRVIRRVFN